MPSSRPNFMDGGAVLIRVSSRAHRRKLLSVQTLTTSLRFPHGPPIHLGYQHSEWVPLHALVLLAITTGARRGELVSLKWADVDLKAGRATIHDTKNGEQRTLPLAGKALEALRQLKLLTCRLSTDQPRLRKWPFRPRTVTPRRSATAVAGGWSKIRPCRQIWSLFLRRRNLSTQSMP